MEWRGVEGVVVEWRGSSWSEGGHRGAEGRVLSSGGGHCKVEGVKVEWRRSMRSGGVIEEWWGSSQSGGGHCRGGRNHLLI